MNGKGTWQAIATLRSRDGIRYLVLDEASIGLIVNPESVQDIPDGTRVYTQYRSVSATLPDFCTEAVRLDWTASVDVGDIRLEHVRFRGRRERPGRRAGYEP